MDHQNHERVQKTLDFIQIDRNLPEDPWFYSRLTARMEQASDQSFKRGWAGMVVFRLRPILAVMVLVIGITGGIALGRVLSSPVVFQEQTGAGFIADEDATTVIFRELSGSFNEQILLMK